VDQFVIIADPRRKRHRALRAPNRALVTLSMIDAFVPPAPAPPRPRTPLRPEDPERPALERARRDFVALRPDQTAAQALEQLRAAELPEGSSTSTSPMRTAA
jgi:hypothetical protein